jgi:outer membrane protein OmpA-like peptidoglycan-associated protein
VTVTLDPLFDLGTIIGKVFEDKDEDGWQDRGETGIARVMVALDDGTYALTDEHGRYHFPAVRPGQRLVKINLQTLAPGAVTTTDEARVLHVTNGLLAKANFGVAYRQETEKIGEPAVFGLSMESVENVEPIEVVGSAEIPSVLVNGQFASLSNSDIRVGVKSLEEVVKIKGGKLEKPVVFQVRKSNPREAKKWILTVMNAAGNPIRTWKGEGPLPPTVQWDGSTEGGQLVKGGRICQYQLQVWYLDGDYTASPRRLFGVNQTDAISLTLTGGAFVTGSATLSPEARKILKKTAEILREYPEETIVIEGHTDSVGKDQYNLDLSRKRAKSAAVCLIKDEGIKTDRLVIKFSGESRPIANNDTPEGRELNRRVEIKGTIDKVTEARILDQYRVNPTVRINESPLEVDEYGRFSTQIEEKGVDKLKIEVSDSRGRTLKTIVSVPSLEILRPNGEVRLAYGSEEDGCRVHKPSGSGGWDPGAVAAVYRLEGRTEPENRVEMDGKPLPIGSDGRFADDLELKVGENVCALVVRNPGGHLRVVNLLVRVTDKDEEGKLVIATAPIPNLTVHLPPKGVKLLTPELLVEGMTDPGNRVQINGNPVAVKPDGKFAAPLTLPRGKSTLKVEAIDPEGRVGAIERELEVKRTHLFLVGIVDGKVGMMKGKGYLKGAGMDESTEYFTEGRVAYYLKGVIAGKYLVTSAFDTGTGEFDELFKNLDEGENERLLTNLDPDKFYPVYGDSSTIVYDSQSQGKFYLAVDSDEVHMLFGNYPVQLTDTELATYRRTMFGGQVTYRSVSRTKYGQPDTEIAVFGAEVRQAHMRDRLRATGGSLYFLSHKDVIEGSEQVTLEVRDKDTGLIVARMPQQQNVDYTIKYEEGRVLFNRPISSVSADGKLIDLALLSGNPVFIQVDYETRVDTFEKTAFGGRIRKQIGDHVGVGGTYVNDELASGEYELMGVDTEVRLGKNTRILGEYAESSGTDSRTLVSEDGGLTYTDGTPGSFQEGRAWKVAAEWDVGEWFGAPDKIQVGGYLKRLEPGFLSSGNSPEKGTEKFGGNVKWNPTARDRIQGRYDREEFDNAGPAALSSLDIGTLQWAHDHGWWGVTGEYQMRESENGSGDSMESSGFAAGRLRVKPVEKLTAGLEHQQTVKGPDNNQTTLSTEYQVHPTLALQGSGTTGTKGEAAQGGAVLTLGDGRIYLTERMADDQAGRTTSTILGSEKRIGPSSKIYTEYQWGHGPGGDRNVSLMGAKWQKDLAKGFRLLLAGEYSGADSQAQNGNRYAISTALSYTHPSGIRASTRNEVRKETGATKRLQFLTSNHIDWKWTPDFTLLGKFRYSRTRDERLDRTEAEFEERSIGIAYRPVRYDRFNALARYTKLRDQRPVSLAGGEVSDTESDVASIEWSWELHRYLEWVTKEAAKFKKDESGDGPSVKTHTYLTIQRLNFHLWKRIDFGAEYRILFQEEADDLRQGWLTEFTWEAIDHLRFGVGYNFTDFSDNEFSENDYSVHGVFVRMQGKF